MQGLGVEVVGEALPCHVSQQFMSINREGKGDPPTK